MRCQRLIRVAMIAVLVVVAGCGQVRRSASSATDGTAVPTSVPAQDPNASAVYLNVDGPLLAAAPDGAGGWFIGGRFTRVAGQRRAGLAHIGADGALDPAWTPAMRGPADDAGVFALCVVGDAVYVGGLFTSINGRPRKHLAAVNARTGRLLAWNPRPNREVDALAAASGRVYAGGYFTRVGGAIRRSLAAFDADTGALTAWNPEVTGRLWSAADPTVGTLVIDRGRLYAGGLFTSAARRDRYGLAAFNIASGALNAWNPRYVGPVGAVAIAGDTMYVGGNFGAVGGEFDEGDGKERMALAALDARTGRVLPWRADVLLDGDRGNVYALAVVGDRLYVDGEFDELAGEPAGNLGVVSTITGAPIPWQPLPSNGGYSLVAAGDRVFVGGDFNLHDG